MKTLLIIELLISIFSDCMKFNIPDVLYIRYTYRSTDTHLVKDKSCAKIPYYMSMKYSITVSIETEYQFLHEISPLSSYIEYD